MMVTVTATAQVRKLALAMPEVTTAAHFDREAFKVGGKIFATLDDDTLNLRLTPEQQAALRATVTAAQPCVGAWGRQGWTAVRHADTGRDDLAEWLLEAWLYRAPTKLRAAHER